MAEGLDEDLPPEIQERISDFHDSITAVEDIFNELHSVPLSERQEKMSTLDKAKLELLSAYALNSLFWSYLNVKGVNPKEHPIKQELERIRSYMGRVKEIQDKEKAPTVDQKAAKRFVRNALWEQAHKKAAGPSEPDKPATSKATDSPADDRSNTDEVPAKKAKSSEKKHKKKKKKDR